MNFVQDTLVSFRREIGPTLRSWYYILFGIIQPLLYLGLFVPLLTSVPMGGEGHPPWRLPASMMVVCSTWSRIRWRCR